jgi:hypothetical protein
VRIGNRTGIVRLGAPDFDEDCAHGAIKASGSAAFMSHDSRSANGVDYYRNGARRAIAAQEKTRPSS